LHYTFFYNIVLIFFTFENSASGASTFAYWMGNFIFDTLLIGFFVLIFAAVLSIFNPSEFSHDGYGQVVLPGVFFTIASIFRFYSFSYFIADVKLAQSIYFYGSVGVVYVLIDIWITILFTTAKANVSDPVIGTLNVIFTIVDPTFGFYLSILFQNNFLGILTQNPGAFFFSPEVAGDILSSLVGSCILYGFLFIFITENALGFMIQSCWNNAVAAVGGGVGSHGMRVKQMTMQEEEDYKNQIASAPVPANGRRHERASLAQERSTACQDPDVVKERERVQKIVDRQILNPRMSAIFINDLRKVYFARGNVPAKVAVKNVNISIPQGEIFGLLGANGAGKTTLLKMVSGQETPSSGFALINGYDVVTQTNAAQRSMGLCPQFDTLIERLSVRENLLFFGRLKGLYAKDLVPVVEAFMQAMNIKRYENKLIQQLSGGNRRKVSLAVALMGAPPTVYLDEVSFNHVCIFRWSLLTLILHIFSQALVLILLPLVSCGVY
jgi:ABC-type Na+ transport system ATPase subunit NatA